MPIKHMKAKKDNHRGIPKGNYLYEVKYDGIRCWIVWDKRTGVTILSKDGRRDISRKFPELMDPNNWDVILPHSATFDAELVCFKKGVPNFAAITSRFHLNSPGGWAQGAIDNPVCAVIFDIPYLNDQSLMEKPLSNRQVRLAGALLDEEPFLISRVFRNGHKLYDREKKRGAEGIIAKDPHSQYEPGRRRKVWLKVKIMYREEVEVYGFTKGKGKRIAQFGSLLFRGLDGRPAGKVGTGLTEREFDDMTDYLETCDPYETPRKGTYHINKPFRIIVEGMKKNESGAIREPTYVEAL